MTEAEAAAEATRLNFALGDAGRTREFYIDVEVRPGEWEVELRTEEDEPPKGLIGRLVQAWLGSSTPGP